MKNALTYVIPGKAAELPWPFVLAVVLVVSGCILIWMLFISRIIKSYNENRKNRLKYSFQKILNKVIVNETFSSPGFPTSAFEFYMAEFRLITGRSGFAEQVLISQLLELKKNLTGNSAQTLVATYYALSLYNRSIKNLRNGTWPKRARAIRELAEMNYQECIPVISKFLYAKNKTLQQESFMALVRLEKEPLSFMNHYHGDLSPWMQMNIHHYLAKLDPRKVPVFSQWFSNKNFSIQIFALRMASQFRQSASLPGIVEMLYHSSPEIVSYAVTAIGELEAYQYKDNVAALARHVWKFEKVCTRTIECLGKISDHDTDADLIGEFLLHPSYSVRFEAVAALKKFGEKGERFLQRFKTTTGNENKIYSIMQHFSDPLLS